MWWAGSEKAQIYLGQTSVGVFDSSSHGDGVQWLPATSAHDAWAKAWEVLNKSERRSRRRIVVLLSGALCRPFMFGPVDGLRRWSEAVQLAAGLAPEATGLDGPCEVWLDHWTPGRPCIAVAVDRGLRDALETVARREGAALVAVKPWWAIALNEVARQKQPVARMLAVEEADVLTVLCGSGEGFVSAASYVPKPDLVQTAAVLMRGQLAAGVSSDLVLRARMRESPVNEAGADAKQAEPFAVQLEAML